MVAQMAKGGAISKIVQFRTLFWASFPIIIGNELKMPYIFKNRSIWSHWREIQNLLFLFIFLKKLVM